MTKYLNDLSYFLLGLVMAILITWIALSLGHSSIDYFRQMWNGGGR